MGYWNRGEHKSAEPFNKLKRQKKNKQKKTKKKKLDIVTE